MIPDFSERQHVFAEHSDDVECVGKDCISEVCSDYSGLFASLSWNLARE